MDRVVLVTGGSGAVGGAIVRRFSQDAFKVAFTFLHHQERAEKLQNETGALGFQGDLADREQVKEIVKRFLNFRHVDVLNNAGLTQVMPCLIEERSMIYANLKTMFL
jgi:NAD(P)-dependent dehydrogenase (short-subunit alcohol dehydrogenase family)